MKKFCYPKYSYVIFLVMSIVFLLLTFAPLIWPSNDEVVYKVMWSIMMFVFSVLLFIGMLSYRQWYFLEKDSITVHNAFGLIMRIDLRQSRVLIEKLPTYFSWVVTINRTWICIYDQECKKGFSSGCSNTRKNKRLQVIYSVDAYQEIVRHTTNSMTPDITGKHLD